MQKRKLLVVVILLSMAQLTFAQTITPDTVLGLIKSGMAPAVSKLTSTAISWLGVFALLQFLITNYGLLKSDGDLQAVIAKLTASITWVGVCLYIINNGPDFIGAVGDEIMGIVGFDLPSASGVVEQTVKLSAIMAGVAVAASAAPFVGDTIGTLLLYVAIGLLILGFLFAFKVFMLQLELGLIVLLAPLSFAFLGLSTLKDQGIAPFKSLLSFAYRAIVLTIILSAFSQVSDAVVDSISAVKASTIISNGIGNIINTILSALGAYILLALLVWKSDAIAASMASGSTSLGNSDVASAAAAGAAAGAVVASAGAAAAGGAAQAPQSMANFMSSLSGGGTVSNAGGMGGGGASSAPLKPASSPSLSRVGTTGGNSGSPGAPNTGGPAMSGKPSAVSSGRYGTEGSSNPTGSDTTQTDQATQTGGNDSVSIAPANPSTGSASQMTAGNSNKVSAGSSDAPSKQKTTANGGSNSDTSPTESTPPSPGSGSTAAIGSNDQIQKSLDQIAQSLANQGPKKPTLKEQLSQANQQVERERDTTHVHISAHHSDS